MQGYDIMDDVILRPVAIVTTLILRFQFLGYPTGQLQAADLHELTREFGYLFPATH